METFDAMTLQMSIM